MDKKVLEVTPEVSEKANAPIENTRLLKKFNKAENKAMGAFRKVINKMGEIAYEMTKSINKHSEKITKRDDENECDKLTIKGLETQRKHVEDRAKKIADVFGLDG